MINTLRACGQKDRPWLDRYLAPLNIILAVLVSATSLLGNAVTVAGLTAQIGMILLVGTLVPPNLLHLERFKRGGVVKTLAKLRAPLGISSGVWFVSLSSSTSRCRSGRNLPPRTSSAPSR